MCNLYRLTTTTEALRTLFNAMEGPSPRLASEADFYPDRPAPVIVSTATGRALATMTWGVPPPPGVARPVINIRNLESPFWRPLLGGSHRCLVPASAFAEWSTAPDPATGRKRRHWFALRSTPLFAFAGLFSPGADGPRFAFLTCLPNATVASIHPKAMPVLLTGAAFDHWLAGADARAFQHPVPDDQMVRLA